MLTLLNKTYDGDSIVDVERDVWEAFDPSFTPQAARIPTGAGGIHQGAFKVTVVWYDTDEPEAP